MTVLYLKQGDADTFTETITGLSSLSGYTGKLYIYDSASVLKLTLTGVVSGLTITYSIVNEQSKALSAGKYPFEAKIFDTADHVYTTSYGSLIIVTVKNTDPS